MKILHYSLGFPPYRSGGMTTFCTDLMEQQIKNNNEVALLWPGRMKFVSKKVKIKCSKLASNIISFEIINPLPISYDEGICNIDYFIDNKEHKCFFELLKSFKPDVIHIHTLMGLHKSFLDFAKKLDIKLVFTTHDFFPICPKLTLLKNNKICNDYNCNECNGTALSINKIKLLQSKIYRKVKNSKLIKILRKNHREKFFCNKIVSVNKKQDYNKLKYYYKSMLEYIDVIHYNSKFTKSIYEKFLKSKNNIVISITHKNIKDNKKYKHYKNNCLRIRFCGTKATFKGFFILKDACEKLYQENFLFNLDIHFMEEAEYINVNEKYSYSDLENIFYNTDILIAPSLCETFNYTVLESLSFGCPVIISDKVGAKDIISEGCGIIIKDITSEKLFKILKGLTKEKLCEMNLNIIKNQKILTIEEMETKIKEECYERR